MRNEAKEELALLRASIERVGGSLERAGRNAAKVDLVIESAILAVGFVIGCAAIGEGLEAVAAAL